MNTNPHSSSAAPSSPAASADNSKKLGLVGLVAIVFGGMIGGAMFDIPQNMAEYSGMAPSLIAWAVTLAGFMLLVTTFQILSNKRPQLNAGIYQYAQVGFGNYVGFNIGWGFWLGSAMGNVAFGVMVCQSLGAFWPPLLKGGWEMGVLGSLFVWLMFAIGAAGMKKAANLNTIVTIVKFAALIFMIVLMCVAFSMRQFLTDVWGTAPQTAYLGSVVEQVKNTMLVTLWCFVGVSGAIVMSGRAKNPSDVGRAGKIGFLMAFVLYAAVATLGYGIVPLVQLGKLPDPSVAYMLKGTIGAWVYYVVIICVVVSVLGGWIAWTLVTAQTAYSAAQVKILPRGLMKESKSGAPIAALFVSSVIMQVFMILVVTANGVYMAAIKLTGVIMLPSYLFCGLYMIKDTYCRDRARRLPYKSKGQLAWMRFIGIATTIYACWVIYAGGLMLFLLTSILYVCGIWFYVRTRRQYAASPGEKVFTTGEKWLLWGLCVAAAVSVALLVTGVAKI